MSGQTRIPFEVALEFLPAGDAIHTFVGGGIALLGADWERDALLEALRHATDIFVTGPAAQSTKHGLAIKHPRLDAMLFIETTRPTA